MKKRPAPCPNIDQHTGSPSGYLEWHAWAERMAKTHDQERCPACGLWAIWVRRHEGDEATTTAGEE